jgi:hypothetical protein
MDGIDILDRRSGHYILPNAPLEELATGFRWVEGLVWMGDAGCLLFQDLPRDRTCAGSRAQVSRYIGRLQGMRMVKRAIVRVGSFPAPIWSAACFAQNWTALSCSL